MGKRAILQLDFSYAVFYLQHIFGHNLVLYLSYHFWHQSSVWFFSLWVLLRFGFGSFKLFQFELWNLVLKVKASSHVGVAISELSFAIVELCHSLKVSHLDGFLDWLSE